MFKVMVAITAVVGFLVIVLAGLIRAETAVAEDAKPEASFPCPLGPQGPQPCKVITLTQQEEQALLGERGVLETALQGRPLDLLGAVTYFREKIRAAPAGTMPAPPARPEAVPGPQSEATPQNGSATPQNGSALKPGQRGRPPIPPPGSPAAAYPTPP